MPNSYGYYRVSSLDQAEGYSPDAQQRLIRDYHARTAGLPPLVDPMHGDLGESAYKVRFGARPAGKDLLNRLKKGDHLIFAFHDRAFRSMFDFTQTMALWRERGCIVHFQNIGFDTGSPMGKLVLNVLMAFAEFEPQMNSARQKASYMECMKTGQPWTYPQRGRGPAFKTPLGFKEVIDRHDKPKWRLNWPEIIALYQIVKWHKTGVSWRTIHRNMVKETSTIVELGRLHRRITEDTNFCKNFYQATWLKIWPDHPFYCKIVDWLIANDGAGSPPDFQS